MDSIQLKKIVNKVFPVENNIYLGSYCNDETPFLSRMTYRRNFFFIMNTIKTNQTYIIGHYVLFIYLNNVLYFFDSFGKSPRDYGGNIAYLYEMCFSKKKIISNYQTQTSNSLLCGVYCIFVAQLFLIKNKNIHEVRSIFSKKNLKKNDKLIEMFIYSSSILKGKCYRRLCPANMFKNRKCSNRCVCDNKI